VGGYHPRELVGRTRGQANAPPALASGLMNPGSLVIDVTCWVVLLLCSREEGLGRCVMGS